MLSTLAILLRLDMPIRIKARIRNSVESAFFFWHLKAVFWLHVFVYLFHKVREDSKKGRVKICQQVLEFSVSKRWSA